MLFECAGASIEQVTVDIEGRDLMAGYGNLLVGKLSSELGVGMHLGGGCIEQTSETHLSLAHESVDGLSNR